MALWNFQVTPLAGDDGQLLFPGYQPKHPCLGLLLHANLVLVHTSTWATLEGKLMRLDNFDDGAWKASVSSGGEEILQHQPIFRSIGRIHIDFAEDPPGQAWAKPDYVWCSRKE